MRKHLRRNKYVNSDKGRLVIGAGLGILVGAMLGSVGIGFALGAGAGYAANKMKKKSY